MDRVSMASGHFWGRKINLHVGISQFPRGKRKFSTWRRNETSEESNETSEELNETSEEMFLAYVENKK